MTAVAGRVGTIGVDVQRWPALGTTAVLCTDGGCGSSARGAAEREIAEIDAAASRFCESSELSRVNRAGGRWLPISERLLEALQLALRAAAITDGAVDPTLGGSLTALGYDRAGQLITVASGGLATSSLVPRRWYHDGRAVHHALDPRTGLPVRPVWRTASVAATSCAEANIASTAALVLGSEAPAWLADHALPARLVTVDGAVETQGGWPR